MNIWPHPNLNNFVCILCNTSKDAPITMIAIDGTARGDIEQAAQVHVSCIELRYSKDLNLVYQKLD
jgi:hypothetical protein